MFILEGTFRKFGGGNTGNLLIRPGSIFEEEQ
jgi:hypothetical protein